MLKIGCVTIGQSPRVDVAEDISRILGDSIQVLEAGALDGMGNEELAAIAPKPGDYVLVSRLRDGRQVRMAERHILPLLQQRISFLEEKGAELIVMLCTGEFPTFSSRVPVVYVCKVLEALVPILADSGRVAVIVPDASQFEQNRLHWENTVQNPYIVAASPYTNERELDDAIKELNAQAPDAVLVVMDCVGYSLAMKQKVHAETGKRVILPRTLLAHLLKELDVAP